MTEPAPIVQLLLTVQFQPAARSLTMLDWADFRKEFAVEYPIFSQVSRAGAMNPDPAVDVIDPPFGFPRMQMVTEDLTGTLFLQDDRMSLGWQRSAPLGVDPGYPGFQAMLDRSLVMLGRVLDFLERRAAETVHVAAAELAYTDAFAMLDADGRQRSLEDVFTCVRSNQDFVFNRVHLTYQRPLLPAEALSGNVQTTISGLLAAPTGEIVSNLQTVVRFDVSGADPDGLRGRFEAAHHVAEKIYATLVKPGASAISHPS